MNARLTKILNIVMLAIVVSIFSGVVYSQDFESVEVVPEDAALIYLYFPYKSHSGAIFKIKIGSDSTQSNTGDDGLLIKLHNGEYYPVFVKPGEVIILGGQYYLDSVVRLDAKAGETYYIKVAITSKISHLLLSPEDGVKEIEKCKLMTK